MQESFREHRQNMSSNDDINILLLGQIGVGKTTFINAFANYLVYNSLDEAIDGSLQVIIPTSFPFVNPDTYEEKTIIIGTPNENEKKSLAEESHTRECQSFVFRIGNRNLRLINTPGIGDRQDIKQDEKSFEGILNYIAQFEYLNGICIILKPDEARLPILFRFCIKELLRHLHVHARQNIMFIFTNARTTFYQPGQSVPILRGFLKTLEDKSGTEVPFSRENTFLVDNEAFRFLALCKNGIKLKADEKHSYSISWDYSIREFSRLMSRIIKYDKHATREALSLNEAQQLIRKLSRPIGEIATLIEENIELAKQHKNSIISCNTPTPQFLLRPQKDTRIVPLRYPRTVCTNNRCTKIITVDGMHQVDYVSHCHSKCYCVADVEQETIGYEKLKYCSVIDRSSGNSKLFYERYFNIFIVRYITL